MLAADLFDPAVFAEHHCFGGYDSDLRNSEAVMTLRFWKICGSTRADPKSSS
jgi:hypothetical protein